MFRIISFGSESGYGTWQWMAFQNQKGVLEVFWWSSLWGYQILQHIRYFSKT
jgi:hypothetical protein